MTAEVAGAIRGRGLNFGPYVFLYFYLFVPVSVHVDSVNSHCHTCPYRIIDIMATLVLWISISHNNLIFHVEDRQRQRPTMSVELPNTTDKLTLHFMDFSAVAHFNLMHKNTLFFLFTRAP